MFFYYLMPVIFLLGILGIAFEDVIKINKAATAVGMSILLWALFIINAEQFLVLNPPQYVKEFMAMFPELANIPTHELAFKFVEHKLIHGLGDVATTLFFVLGSMAIIDVIDSHGGFGIISQSIRTNHQRKLLWILSFVTFFMSVLLGNIATVIVIVAIARKLIPDCNIRLVYSCMIIIAANAGGSFSPIGDVTTLLLWTGGNISALHQITTLALPALVMLLVPLTITTFLIPKGCTIEPLTTTVDESNIDPKMRKRVLWVGIGSLAMVPVLQTLIELPPFMGVLIGLILLWIITDRHYAETESEEVQNLRVHRSLARVDIGTVFFFLGILLSVQALNVTGQLGILANYLSATFENENTIAIVLGVMSSFLDNVALVSATMGMYPIEAMGAFAMDSSFWTLLAYCAVTGGSILIIGSASGVTVMGMEKITFGYYLKRFTPIVLLGYFAGVLVYMCIA